MEAKPSSRILKSAMADDVSRIHKYDMEQEFGDPLRTSSFVAEAMEPEYGAWDPPDNFGVNQRDASHDSRGSSTPNSQPNEASAVAPDPIVESPSRPSADEALMGGAIQELMREQERLRASMTDRVCDLARAIAHRIIGNACEQQPEMVLSLVRCALEKVERDPTLTIRVHPKDAEYLQARKDVILASCDHVERLVISADASLCPGGCVIETDRGLVDASIESQLAHLDIAIREQGLATG